MEEDLRAVTLREEGIPLEKFVLTGAEEWVMR